MRGRDSDALTIGELLARVRTTYVDSFAERLTAAKRDSPGRVVPEAVASYDDAENASDAALGLPCAWTPASSPTVRCRAS